MFSLTKSPVNFPPKKLNSWSVLCVSLRGCVFQSRSNPQGLPLKSLQLSASFSSRTKQDIPKVLQIRSQILLYSTSQNLFYSTVFSDASKVFTRPSATTPDWNSVFGWWPAKEAQQIHCFPGRSPSLHTQAVLSFLTYDFTFGQFIIRNCVLPRAVWHSFYSDLHRYQDDSHHPIHPF